MTYSIELRHPAFYQFYKHVIDINADDISSGRPTYNSFVGYLEVELANKSYNAVVRETEYIDAEGDRRLRWFLDFNTDAEAIQFILRWSWQSVLN